MGKVVAAIAIIAVAAAIAFAAPALAGLVVAKGTLAFTALSTAFAVSLSVAASAVYGLTSWAPGDQASGFRLTVKERDRSGFGWVDVPPVEPEPKVLAPIHPRSWLRAYFFPWQRASVTRLSGDCMDGYLEPGTRWAVVSRDAAIKPGSLFALDLDDLWTDYHPEVRWWQRLVCIGMAKRYLGTEPDRGLVIFDCTNPPTMCQTGVNRIRYAYAITSTHRSWLAAARAAWWRQSPGS